MTTPVLAAVRPSASTAARGARVALWGTVRRDGHRFTRRWRIAAVVTGLSYIVAGIGEPLTGFRQIVIYSAGSVAVVAFCLWAAWTSQELREPAAG